MKHNTKMNNVKTKYQICDDESTAPIEDVYESCGIEFKVLTRNQQNALCKRNKRKRDKRRKHDEKQEVNEEFISAFVKRLWCKNCTHQVLSEILIMCALHPVTHSSTFWKVYLTSNTNAPNAVHWLVKFPFYGEILFDAGFQILLGRSDWDILKWENTLYNRKQVRTAFAKLQTKFKEAKWIGHCSKHNWENSQHIFGSIIKDIRTRKILIRTWKLWRFAKQASEEDGAEVGEFFDGISRTHISELLNAQVQAYFSYHYSGHAV